MIKKKINRNNFFYKFYLYFRLIYKEKIFINKKTYSQSGEDKFITSYMNKKKIFNGRYVDLGAFHPTKYSNTCLLYKSGWSGINIDLNQTSIDCFNIVRPNDKNICVAVSDKEKKRKVYINDIFSPLNTLNKNHAKIFNFEFNYKDGYFTHTKRFNRIIKKPFDFLNIDIEGLDYEVLKTINLNFYKPKLICIESLNKNNLIRIKKHLLKNNYFFIKRNITSYFFERKKQI